MSDYPEAVERIVRDYLERLQRQAALVPEPERAEFVLEIESHIYEAFQQEPGTDGVARILAVLRKVGEPAEVVAGRLPESMVRSGTLHQQPLFVVGGILIALFGIPLGFGGVAVLAGVLLTIVAAVAVYYAAAGLVLFSAGLVTAVAMVRLFLPTFWDRMVDAGVIRMDGFLEGVPRAEQAIVMMLLAVLIAVGGIVMLRLGRRMVRGLRFLFRLGVDRLLRGAEKVRSAIHQRRAAARPRWQPVFRRP